MVFIALFAIEVIARWTGPTQVDGLKSVPHGTLGWLPQTGSYRASAREFNTNISINALGMNDRGSVTADRVLPQRWLALGDSHTFGVGVSTEEAWPKRLEAQAFPTGGGIVWNGAVYGYSLGQYLERYRTLKTDLAPNTVIVGFSMATDLYDLIPPERGGFVYGGDAARRYFDLDAQGGLIEKLHEPAATPRAQSLDLASSLRGLLEESALYRALKRSNLAMAIAMHWRPQGKSLWPGLDTALKLELDEDDRYRWQLAEAILGRLAAEVGADGARLVLVNIPYLAQVYDEIWASSFGRLPAMYDRQIAQKRLSEMAKRIGVEFIDTTPALIDAARARKRWLHWRYDGHPTPEGQQLIAEVVASRLAGR